jgi:putative transposase
MPVNTSGRVPYFKDAERARFCRDQLLRYAEVHSFHVHAYCFMPDHLHLLVQGGSGQADLRQFLQRFKQVTGFHFKRARGQQLWQRSFHDHIVRKEEDLQQIAEYIWNNPVRAGMVESWDAYSLSGPFGQT